MDKIVVPFDDEESVASLRSSMNVAAALEPNRNSGNTSGMDILVATFKDLKVEIFAREHPPPHFRVRTDRGTVNFRIDSCEPIKPNKNQAQAVLRRLREIRKWHRGNKQRLIDKWNETRPSDCPVGPYRSSC